MTFSPEDFIRESNRIEDIHRDPTPAETEEYHRFMALPEVTIPDLQIFVTVYQPGAGLRERAGMNVFVGSYVPPAGGIAIKTRLEDILTDARIRREAYAVHQRYEHLHPFTDGNGRSGRMLWMWMMRQAPLGFLHSWYYQSLQNAR